MSPFLVFYYRKTKGAQNQLGITVSGKLGNAVVRNKIRRRIREIYRTNEERLMSGYLLVVVARGRAVTASYAELEQSFLQLANKCKLLRPKEEEAE